MYNTAYTHPALDKARAINKQYKNTAANIVGGIRLVTACLIIAVCIFHNHIPNKSNTPVAIANR